MNASIDDLIIDRFGTGFLQAIYFVCDVACGARPDFKESSFRVVLGKIADAVAGTQDQMAILASEIDGLGYDAA